MPQLLVSEVEPEIIQRLHRRAAANGRSDEEEHRQILNEVLVADDADDDFPDLKALLFQMPNVGEDADFERVRDYGRDIDLS